MDWLNSLLLFAAGPTGDFAPAGGAAPAAAGAPQAAGAAAQGAPPCGGNGAMVQIVMIGAIFAIFYFVLIRPQQKRARQHQDMLKALRKGDTVYTQGGMYGRVATLTENTVTLEIAKVDNKDVRVRVLRSAIAGKQTPRAEGGEAKDAENVRQAGAKD